MRYWDRSGVYFVVENGEDKKRNYKFITRICLDHSSMFFFLTMGEMEEN